MTIYDLTQAILRYKWVVLGAFVLLMAAVLAMSFTLQDGKPGWRLGAKYESSVQIAVLDPGIESLSRATAPSSELFGAAALYAALLGTDEASQYVGGENGYKLDEAIKTDTARDAPLITASVFAPSQEQAIGAALSTFTYLEAKLQTPLATADLPSPPTTVVVLDGPFESFLIFNANDGLAVLPEDLFLVIDSGIGGSTTVPLSSMAGRAVPTRATLSPVMTFTLSLQDGGEEGVLDLRRVAPPALPTTQVTETPELVLTLGPDAVRRGVENWELDTDGIRLHWEDSAITAEDALPGKDVQIALLTPIPGTLSIGGRRGPIVLVAALLVGTVLILSSVIVTDTWRGERERQAIAGGLAVNQVATVEGPSPEETAVRAVDEVPDEEAEPVGEADHQWHWRNYG